MILCRLCSCYGNFAFVVIPSGKNRSVNYHMIDRRDPSDRSKQRGFTAVLPFARYFHLQGHVHQLLYCHTRRSKSLRLFRFNV